MAELSLVPPRPAAACTSASSTSLFAVVCLLRPVGIDRHQNSNTSRVVDVGANHGSWTRGALNYFPESYYTLIEPQDWLKTNIQDLLARGNGKVRWIGAGVSDQSGTLPFTISHRDDSSTFALTSNAAEYAGMRQVEVPVFTLNEIVRTNTAPFPDMVKVDAEGLDLRVIAGASELLGRTDIFLLEARSARRTWKKHSRKCSDYQSRVGYRLIDIPVLIVPQNTELLGSVISHFCGTNFRYWPKLFHTNRHLTLAEAENLAIRRSPFSETGPT